MDQGQPFEAAIGAHEPGNEVGRRVGEDLCWRPELGELAADLHDGHQVAELDRLVDVVGHEKDGLGQTLLEAQELVLEAFPDDRVDGAEGLVHQHHGRIGGQRPRHPDALALAAGELARVAIAIEVGLEPDERQELVGEAALPRLVPAQESRHDRDVRPDGEMRKQSNLLDHVADPPPQLDRVLRRDVPPVDQDLPARRLDQPVDHLQARGLAAAGGPHQHTDLACRHAEAEVVDSARTLLPRVVVLADVLELDGGTTGPGRWRGRGATRARAVVGRSSRKGGVHSRTVPDWRDARHAAAHLRAPRTRTVATVDTTEGESPSPGSARRSARAASSCESPCPRPSSGSAGNTTRQRRPASGRTSPCCSRSSM